MNHLPIEFSCTTITKDIVSTLSELDIEHWFFPNATTIEDMSFDWIDNCYCRFVKSLDIPNVTILENQAFCSCLALESASFQNVKIIGPNVFKNCSNYLRSVVFPNVESIGERAFLCCYMLESAIIPNVTNIDDMAFADCESLESIYIPKIVRLGKNVFQYCATLHINNKKTDEVEFQNSLQTGERNTMANYKKWRRNRKMQFWRERENIRLSHNQLLVAPENGTLKNAFSFLNIDLLNEVASFTGALGSTLPKSLRAPIGKEVYTHYREYGHDDFLEEFDHPRGDRARTEFVKKPKIQL